MSIDSSLTELAGTLVAAFAGAWFAFLFEGRKRRRERTSEHVRNGNLALYTIYEFWNAMKQYHDEVATPFKNRDDAWMNMPIATDRFAHTPSLRECDLSFIFGTPQSNVYAELYLQEHRFNTSKSTISMREDIILNKVRPILRSLGQRKALKLTKIQS